MEVPVIEYNENAPTFDSYIRFFSERGFSPVVLEEIHYFGELVAQVDLVFAR